MAPPRNTRRRDALADAAIQILGTAGIHRLSHRSVDEQAGLPHGTAANYFPTRDDLLTAAASRVAGLHLAEMAAADRSAAGRADRDVLAELIGVSLYDSATRHRVRYLAIFELTLEATRSPGLARSMAEVGAAALETTVAEHGALGLATSPEQVQALITMFGGTLLTLVTAPPEAVTRDGTLALARAMVTGTLGPAADAPHARGQIPADETGWRGDGA
ncbi:MAG TPA: TetR/AcrR family transcriptional regulator [Streptosporangiaceae bacterium]|nr:TetR/AcrR family transcriptional regulator [Streptosporangiaceae bacterium]